MTIEKTEYVTDGTTTNDSEKEGGIELCADTLCAYPADLQDTGCGPYSCATLMIMSLGEDKGPDDLSMNDHAVDTKGQSVKVWDPQGKKFVLVDSRLKKLAEAILPMFNLKKCFLHRGTRLVSLAFGDCKSAVEFCIYTKATAAAASTGVWRSGTVIKKVTDPGSEVQRLEGYGCVEFPANDIKAVILLMDICKQYFDVHGR